MKRLSLIPLLVLALCGCQTLQMGGKPKPAALSARVEATREALAETKSQFSAGVGRFRTASQLASVAAADQLKELDAEFRRCERSAVNVRRRIKGVEDVAMAWFKEWRQELGQYADEGLRKTSQKKYDLTVQRYEQLMAGLRSAESQLEPALRPMRDQVLFAKHSLNTGGSARVDSRAIESAAQKLSDELDKAIAAADKFTASLHEG